jgi:hypothetical protein
MAAAIAGAACSVVCWNFCCRPCAGGERIPRGIEGVTAAYLTALLRDGGSLEPSVAVTAVEVQAAGDEGKGLTSDVFFLQLSFDKPSATCPANVVLKMPNSNFEMRVFFSLTGMVTAELGFLRNYPLHMAARASDRQLRTPRLLGSRYNERTQSFVMVSDDMRPAKPGSQLSGSSLADAKRALTLLATLHAGYWEDYTPALAYLRRTDSPENAFIPMVVRCARVAAPPCVGTHGMHLPHLTGRLPTYQPVHHGGAQRLLAQGDAVAAEPLDPGSGGHRAGGAGGATHRRPLEDTQCVGMACFLSEFAGRRLITQNSILAFWLVAGLTAGLTNPAWRPLILSERPR